MTPAERKQHARLEYVSFDEDERLSFVSVRMDREVRRSAGKHIGFVRGAFNGDGREREWELYLSPEHCRTIQHQINVHYRETGDTESSELYPLWAAIAPVSFLFEEF